MASIADIASGLGAIVFFLAPIAIIRPSLIRLHKRRHAVLVWSSFLLLAALSSALSDALGTSGPQEFGAWIGMVMLWGVGFGFGWLICRAIDRRISTSAAPAIDQSGVWPDRMQRWLRQARQDLKSARESAQLDRSAKKQAAEIASLKKIGNNQAKPNTGLTFSVTSSNTIALSGYRDGSNDGENYDFFSEDSQGEYGTILRRGSDGRPLTFEYASRHGVVSTRSLFQWVEYPQHVQGVCGEADKVICFRKDRVIEWLAESNKMLRAPKGKSRA